MIQCNKLCKINEVNLQHQGGGAADSLVHIPDQAQPAAIPEPDEHPVPVASQEVIYSDDPGVAQEPDPSVADEVLQYDQRPKPPLATVNSNEETRQAMYVMLRRIGFQSMLGTLQHLSVPLQM